MGENYDENKERIDMFNVDCNNQYGAAMSQLLPQKDFKWIEDVEKVFNEEKIKKLDPLGKTGWFFEVDVEVPEEVHDWHDTFPLLPENLNIKKEELSRHQQRLAKKYNVGISVESPKLVCTLKDKVKYKRKNNNKLILKQKTLFRKTM